jgi:hypothetical protein
MSNLSELGSDGDSAFHLVQPDERDAELGNTGCIAFNESTDARNRTSVPLSADR